MRETRLGGIGSEAERGSAKEKSRERLVWLFEDVVMAERTGEAMPLVLSLWFSKAHVLKDTTY